MIQVDLITIPSWKRDTIELREISTAALIKKRLA